MINSYKNYFLKNKTLVICAAVMIAIIIFAAIFATKLSLDNTELYFSSEKPDGNVGQIYSELNGFSVSQTFICDRSDLYGLALNFATYQTIADGTVKIKLTNLTTNTVVYEHEVPAAEVGDNAYRAFYFDPVKNCKKHEFKIEISARNGNDLVVKPITLWCSNTNSYNGELTVTQFGAESKREGDLNLRLYSSKNYGFNETLILAISVSLIAFIIAKVDMDRREKEKRETDASTKSDCIESKS